MEKETVKIVKSLEDLSGKAFGGLDEDAGSAVHCPGYIYIYIYAFQDAQSRSV
jgi:hypothetical protein